MSLRIHDRVDATLRRLTQRSSVRDLTRADVDDMLWAIRQLNERNEVVHDVLNRTDDAILSERDIERMEETLAAVRNLYRWVAETNRASGKTRELSADGDAPPTLRGIATQYGVSLNALRRSNPQLDDYGAEETLPPETHVKIPRRSSRSRTRRPSAGFVRTLRNISEKSGVPVRVLRRHNPDAEPFGENDVLPDDLPINVPVDAGAPPVADPDADLPRGRPVTPRRTKSAQLDPRADRGSISWSQYVTYGNESVRTVADDVLGVSIADLREANPILEQFEDDEILPARLKLIVDRNGARLRREQAEQAQRRTGGPRDAPDFIASGRETLDAAARILGVHIRALVAANPHAESYGAHRPLPPGLELYAPS